MRLTVILNQCIERNDKESGSQTEKQKVTCMQPGAADKREQKERKGDTDRTQRDNTDLDMVARYFAGDDRTNHDPDPGYRHHPLHDNRIVDAQAVFGIFGKG